MSEGISKICPYCAERINAAAKICPWCRQWLSVFSLRNPAVFTVVFYSFFLVCAIGFLAFLQRVVKPGVDFSPYRDSIPIVESRMNLQADDKQPMVNVVVVVTNKSDLAWKNVQLDTRFYDKAGVLIDAREYTDSSMILSHGELAFRIRLQPSHALSDYNSYQIYVRAARDARSHF